MKPKSLQSILAVVLLATLVVISNTEMASAPGTIYIIFIRENGDVFSNPPGAPIQRDGDVYTFINSIDGNITVEKDNIVIDGNNHLLNGTGSGFGFHVANRINVTISNLHIAHFKYGICLNESNGNVLTRNSLTHNLEAGILISNSSSNLIRRNTVFNNTHDGISLWGQRTQSNVITGNNVSNNGGIGGRDGISIGMRSSYNTIVNNTISGNTGAGIALGYEWSTGNIITGNNITLNGWTGIYMAWETESGNQFYHNNINNNFQVNSVEATNAWDNGYLSGGNYWSDYTGSDLNGDGIGDTPYVIDVNNQDNYPFMNPWTPEAYDVAIEDVEPSKTYVGQNCNVTITVTVTNQGCYTQTFNITAYAGQTRIEKRTISLANQSSETLTFTWNTAGITRGFYTLNATADQMPGEIDTHDNTLVYNAVMVTIPGDLDGNKKVDGVDFGIFAPCYGSSAGQANYGAVADINESGKVDGVDFGIFAPNYGMSW